MPLHGSQHSPAPQRIAVVGLGRAGTARVRALDAHPTATLAAVVRRAPSAPTFESVLADPAITAVIVCTPNALHAVQVGAALRAGKHVAVEFPLAATEREARALFGLAREAGRVLHVEHIELLSPSQQQLRAAARGLGPPVGGQLRFTGDASGWIGDAALAGGAGLRALARLHRLVDLFGPAALERAALERGAAGAYRLAVGLRFARGGALELIEERSPGLRRATEWDVWCEGGRLEPPAPEAPAGLFARDLELFLARVQRGGPGYVSEERELHVHALVDAIESRWVSCAPC